MLNNANENKLYTNGKLNIRNNDNHNNKDNNTYSLNIQNKKFDLYSENLKSIENTNNNFFLNLIISILIIINILIYVTMIFIMKIIISLYLI